MRLLLAGLSALSLLASCSTLPRPGSAAEPPPSDAAAALLRQSARAHGDPWRTYRQVEVGYTGEWSGLATRLQPVLTDAGFRKDSVETYQPRQSRVRQVHTGPLGTKEVLREGREVTVKFNGAAATDPEVLDAAALVADAYTVFLFGTSWLAEQGRELRLLGERDLDGKRCQLVAGRLAPGFGVADEDHFIVWIEPESHLLKRFQFSLNGLDSTRGADVDVVFSDFWLAENDSSTWPGRFVERIQRPLRAKAHEWRMTSLTVDGRKLR
jgi:hypothetical protein